MRFNLILAQTSIALYFGGRSLWLEKIKKGDRSWCVIGRSLSVQLSQCLVFAAKGDRSF